MGTDLISSARRDCQLVCTRNTEESVAYRYQWEVANAKDGASGTAKVSASRGSARPQPTSVLRRRRRLRALPSDAGGLQRKAGRQSIRMVSDDESCAFVIGAK